MKLTKLAEGELETLGDTAVRRLVRSLAWDVRSAKKELQRKSTWEGLHDRESHMEETVKIKAGNK